MLACICVSVRFKMDTAEKSKRVVISVNPSKINDFTKIVFIKKSTFSKIISLFIDEYIEKNKDILKKYNEVFEDEK